MTTTKAQVEKLEKAADATTPATPATIVFRCYIDMGQESYWFVYDSRTESPLVNWRVYGPRELDALKQSGHDVFIWWDSHTHTGNRLNQDYTWDSPAWSECNFFPWGGEIHEGYFLDNWQTWWEANGKPKLNPTSTKKIMPLEEATHEVKK